jgi:hypothetical protein
MTIHANFMELADPSLSSTRCLEILDQMNQYRPHSDNAPISQEVLTDYYAICLHQGLIEDCQEPIIQWAKKNLDREPQIRMAAIASALFKLTISSDQAYSKSLCTISSLQKKERCYKIVCEDDVQQLKTEIAHLKKTIADLRNELFCQRTANHSYVFSYLSKNSNLFL